MINRHSEHNHEEETCKICQWSNNAFDTLNGNDTMNVLKVITESERKSLDAFAFLLSLGQVATALNQPEPQTIDDMLNLLALIRVNAKELGEFPFKFVKGK